MSLIKPKSYYEEYKEITRMYNEQMVRLESLSIKWNKRGKSLTTWDEALEELNEEYIA